MLLALQMWSMPSCSTQWGQKNLRSDLIFFKDKLMQEGTFFCMSATEQFDNANKGSEKKILSHINLALTLHFQKKMSYWYQRKCCSLKSKYQNSIAISKLFQSYFERKEYCSLQAHAGPKLPELNIHSNIISIVEFWEQWLTSKFFHRFRIFYIRQCSTIIHQVLGQRYFWFWEKFVLTKFRVKQVKMYQLMQNQVKSTLVKKFLFHSTC